MLRRRQLAIALVVVAAALAVLLAAGQAAVRQHTSPSPAQLPVLTGGSGPKPRLSAHAYAVWADADQRFQNAARAFLTALGGCRMRLGSFHACVIAAAGAMAYEEHNAAGATAAYESRPGPCGRALHVYRSQLARYLVRAGAFAGLPHGHPMDALRHLQVELLRAQERFGQAAAGVRDICRPD